MRVLKLLFVFVAMLSIVPCFAKHIYLKGKWRPIHKSITTDLPMDAILEESSKDLSVSFHENLGLVYINVTDEKGEVVYSESVQATVSSVLVVPLDELNKGGMLQIGDGINNVYGEF